MLLGLTRLAARFWLTAIGVWCAAASSAAPSVALVLLSISRATSTSSTATTTATSTTSTIARPPFLRLGNGDCLGVGGRPVQGASRRDMDHGSCRSFCRDESCLGYAYAPCERICTVYGESQSLLVGQDSTNWMAINGWGRIATSTDKCGSACFLRKNPCLAGSVQSAGAVVAYARIAFGDTADVPCQRPYRGSIQLNCGITGSQVVSGRCLRQCPGGSYFDRSFQVFYPASLHGDITSASCPRGAAGNITMQCFDGEAVYIYGRCGYNCAPGSLRAGSGIVMYPALNHETAATLPCPTGWTGSPVVRCEDSLVTIVSGRCDRQCDAGSIIVQVGTTAANLLYGPLQHNRSVQVACPAPSFTGQLGLACFDGQVSLDTRNGTCRRNCLPGSINAGGPPDDAISPRRNVSYGSMADGSRLSLQCNAGFYSFPEDSFYLISQEDGFIYRQPIRLLSPTSGFGDVLNEYKQVVALAISGGLLYVVGSDDYFMYRQPLSTIMPTSYWGEAISASMRLLSIAIADGYVYGVSLEDGMVYKQPLDTMTPSSSWARITTDNKKIASVAIMRGMIYAVGKVENRIFRKAATSNFSAWDGPITGTFNLQIDSIQIAAGIVYAAANRKVYTQVFANMTDVSAWVGPLTGDQRILSIGIEIVNTTNVTGTWNAGFNGTLLVECTDGAVKLLQGECKMHCVASSAISNNVALPYRNMTQGSFQILTCPARYTGQLKGVCVDGTVKFTGFCGRNCLATVVQSNAAQVQVPPLNHSDIVVWSNVSCPAPYRGAVSFRCFDGALRMGYGTCFQPCVGGTYRTSSAQIVYPALNHSASYTGTCVARYPRLSYSGNVTFTCIDGEVVNDGGCFADCTEGVFQTANGVNVMHGLIPSGQSLPQICQPSISFGVVLVKCDRGFPVVVSGSCGSPCYQSLYNGVATRDWDLLVPDIVHLGSLWMDCPLQVSGRIHFQCNNKILTVDAGSCGERCLAQSLSVYGGNFISPIMQHLETFDQPCMPPFVGTITLSCSYGVLSVISQCKQGCFAGNITVPREATIFYPDLIPDQQYGAQCPVGYAGSVSLRCSDLVPFASSGVCHKHCQPGRFRSSDGLWNVEYGLIYHNATQEALCDPAFDGYIVLGCSDGIVALQEGGCFKRCPDGRYTVRPGIVLRYTSLANNQMTPSMECPTGFVGSVRLICTDGVMGIAAGGCPANCESGYVQGAQYNGMSHLEYASLVCPIAGTVSVKCIDGVVTLLGGRCLSGCAAGSIAYEENSYIQYGAINHLGVVTGTCAGNSSGYIQVNCSDSIAALDPLPGQGCYKHCGAQVLTTADGSLISAPILKHGQQIPIHCPAGLPGVITVRCSDGMAFIASGQCGSMNCRRGLVQVGQAPVPNPEINDGDESVVPSQCSAHYLGAATFRCSNGRTTALNVSLLYPAIPGLEAVDFNVSNMSSGFLMQHDEDYFYICGCCIPQQTPLGAAPIGGVDLRTIIYWAVGVAVLFVLLAVIAGVWVLRPAHFRKASRIHPNKLTLPPSPTSKASEGAIVAYVRPPPEKLQMQPFKPMRESYKGEVNNW